MINNTKILYDRIVNTPHIGELIGDNIIHGTAGRAGRSDVVDIYLRVANGIIHEVKFKAHGSAATLAAAALAAEKLHHLAVNQITEVTYPLIIKTLQLASNEMSSAVLVESALQSAMQQIENDHE
ncbi:MAG: iron-sulfur cluster assembly scaffold protein [Gammaproteobacteria bacterium]|nr:iron-sulfur cluster assembly scaffold protein [Gammaproteobacteria bacterium]